MTYPHQRELDFALSLLERLRIPARQLQADDPLSLCDGGLRKALGMEADHEYSAVFGARWAQEGTIYKIVDQFQCRYICLRLPGAGTVLVIGPYLTKDLSPGDLLELAEHLGLPVDRLPRMANHFAALPVHQDPTALFAIMYTLGDTLWGRDSFEIVDVEEARRDRLPASASAGAPVEQAHILEQMRDLEERYAYEDKLMEIVARGLTHQAELLLSSVSQLNFQARTMDPLRNQKNYCIICNTLMRKAAQRGGAHPFHIDRMSSQFARAIENAPTMKKCSALIVEMVVAYCRLVHEQTRRQYAPAIQKVLMYIDANLSGDLTLPTLAGLVRVTPGYLSTLFRRQTHRTLAEHIRLTRLEAALSLLTTTQLQVQTVAQLCGFGDPNYFARQFKRHYGFTPQQCRLSQGIPRTADPP